MNGILIMDKPQGFTSFDVVAKLRGICGTRKIGHSGTLDPMAIGVLPVFIGPAVKAVDLQPEQDKTYVADLLFGISTDTGDITGEVLRQMNDVQITRQRLEYALAGFCGVQQQTPPMFSAVKVAGKPLYKYAREGKQVDRKSREVTVHSIDYLQQVGENRHRIKVHCSKGTYIRTLCEDIGETLGAPATLAALRRTGAGVFDESQAHSFDDVQAARDEGRLDTLLLGVETLFTALPVLNLNGGQCKRLQNGAPAYGLQAAPGRYRVRGPEGFLGLAVLDEDGYLRTEKLFVAHG